MEATYTVRGMTCQHCVASVQEEIGEVEGVEAVAVDLSTGQVTVTGTADPSAIAEAVNEAGYEVVA